MTTGHDSIKRKISSLISEENYSDLAKLLSDISTPHAGTAKTEFKRYSVNQIVKKIRTSGHKAKEEFFKLGKRFCRSNDDNAKEIGVSLIWRGFSHDPEGTLKIMLRIADDANWEVREYAAGSFTELLRSDTGLHDKMIEFTEHPSENVRRAVLFSALAYKHGDDPAKGFDIISRLMNDGSAYVKKNLGPFILGSHFGNRFPNETFRFLKHWSNSTDKIALWNVAMSFRNSFGNKYPDKALKLMQILVDKRKEYCLGTVKSTLKHLGKRHPEKVQEFYGKNFLK